ncbi:unnamed protein product [Symbiodinium pilosum]|uniref:Uncharacterized protein n=1 Tax=Symbiodinium pilosum TaxID=2952 RepID=A0A812LTQ4_SYMPI|nr:unnamed protein product [Symbiodinium pilosum]
MASDLGQACRCPVCSRRLSGPLAWRPGAVSLAVLESAPQLRVPNLAGRAPQEVQAKPPEEVRRPPAVPRQSLHPPTACQPESTGASALGASQPLVVVVLPEARSGYAAAPLQTACVGAMADGCCKDNASSQSSEARRISLSSASHASCAGPTVEPCLLGNVGVQSPEAPGCVTAATPGPSPPLVSESLDLSEGFLPLGHCASTEEVAHLLEPLAPPEAAKQAACLEPPDPLEELPSPRSAPSESSGSPRLPVASLAKEASTSSQEVQLQLPRAAPLSDSPRMRHDAAAQVPSPKAGAQWWLREAQRRAAERAKAAAEPRERVYRAAASIDAAMRLSRRPHRPPTAVRDHL